MQGDWKLALEHYMASLKVVESPESVIGAARCMQHMNSPLFEITLERGYALLCQERPRPYIDYAPEWVFLIEILGSRVKPAAKNWVTAMSKMVPDSFWQIPGRQQLLKLLGTNPA